MGQGSQRDNTIERRLLITVLNPIALAGLLIPALSPYDTNMSQEHEHFTVKDLGKWIDLSNIEDAQIQRIRY